MAKTSKPKRTQAERREQSRQAVLDSACRLFGEKGYADTSLEDIAADCNLTIRPIYHYFGNKKALFSAVTEHMSARILDTLSVDETLDADETMKRSWRSFLDLCDDPAFRQIVLLDSPNILGREQWSSSLVYNRASEMVDATSPSSGRGKVKQFRATLTNRVMMGAMAEVALTVAEADDIPMAKKEAERLVMTLFARLNDTTG